MSFDIYNEPPLVENMESGLKKSKMRILGFFGVEMRTEQHINVDMKHVGTEVR